MVAETQSRRGRDEGGGVTGAVIGAAIEVHRTLGPGLLERTYEECLCHELELRRIPFQRQVAFAISYKALRVADAYRADVVVRGTVVVEIKAVEQLKPIHKAQLLTYLRVGGFRLGLILNFNAPVLSHGVIRIAHNAGLS